MSVDDLEGRGRHPSGRGSGSNLAASVLRVMARRAPGPGSAEAEVVAECMRAVRGQDGRTVEEFAAALGITAAQVAALEAGGARPQVPAPVAVLTPLVPLVREVARRRSETFATVAGNRPDQESDPWPKRYEQSSPAPKAGP